MKEHNFLKIKIELVQHKYCILCINSLKQVYNPTLTSSYDTKYIKPFTVHNVWNIRKIIENMTVILRSVQPGTTKSRFRDILSADVFG